MRRFANVYIILFMVDAGLSLLDELLAFTAFSLPFVSELRYLMASMVIAFSVVLYPCLGLDRRLPTRVFLPLTLYVSWCALAFWPLASVVGRESLGLLSSVGQGLLGVFAIVLLRRLGGQNLLTRDLFQVPMFSWRNTLGFTAINLLLLPLVLVYTVLATTSYYFEQQTAGFLRLSPVGIYMSERSYSLDRKVIRLAGMMHIGKEEYYRDIARSMSAKETIILAEGVTDRDGLLKSRFNYGNLAELIGLTSQDKMYVDANLVDLENLDKVLQRDKDQTKPDIASADIDLNRFDPTTIEFLNVLGRTLLAGKPLGESLVEYNDWVSENMTEESIAAVMTDIIDKRNEAVIDGMVRTLARYDTIVIPWGAMHMPAIEAAVLEMGFTAGDKHERLSLYFRSIPYLELWQKWSRPTDESL